MKTLRVLNVEDSERDAAMVRRHLSRAGYELFSERVDTSEGMRTALETRKWDVILCDYSMPHFNALSALALRKEMELDIPFIIISGTVGEVVAVEAMRAGAHDYLMKDNLVRLIPTIEREMQEAENRCARRRAEAKLRHSEAQYHRLMDTSNEGIWTADARGDITYANQRVAEMLGYTVERMVGRSAFEFFDDDIRAEMKANWQHRFQNTEEPYDLRLRHRDGAVLWVILSATPIRNEQGRVTGTLAMLTDITERKRTEQLVRLQATALASADNAIIISSHEGAITWVNPAFTTLTGYSSEEVLGQNPRILKSGRHGPELYESMWKSLLSGQVWHGELINMRKDGSTYFEEQTITPVLDEDGVITNFIAIKQDITERKQIEVELEHARDVALESVRLKSEFLANMSHEIRTPMNGIIGMTELVVETDIDDQQRGYLNSIASSAESLLTIINDILDFSKIEAGMLSFETIDFDLRFTIESVLHLMAARIRAKGLEVALLFHHDVPAKLSGDPTRLHQILSNLVGNAVKFTEHGKVVIRVSKQSEDEERVTIRFDVEDTGIGISEADQKMLFSPFVQADGSTTRRYGGTGLGLAIAKKLVEMMGGTIVVKSEPGDGSTFTFTTSMIKQVSQEPGLQPTDESLKDISKPVLESDPRDCLSVVMSANSNTNRGPMELITKHSLNKMDTNLDRSVLLVEDNEINQSVAWGQLAILGYKVDVASNGQEALDALEHRSYDVVLMDCGMPVMDGYTATAEIRKREGKSTHTPIIAMTAHAMNGDREKCLAAGMDAYITKPVNRKTIDTVLATLFGNGTVSAVKRFPSVSMGIGTTNDLSIVDLVCLRDAASSPEKLRRLVNLYLRHTDERLEELRTAIEQESAANVYAIAHKCLGSSSTCGMRAIVPALTELQRMGKAGDLNGAADQFEAAQAAFHKLSPFLEQYLEQLAA